MARVLKGFHSFTCTLGKLSLAILHGWCTKQQHCLISLICTLCKRSPPAIINKHHRQGQLSLAIPPWIRTIIIVYSTEIMEILCSGQSINGSYKLQNHDILSKEMQAVGLTSWLRLCVRCALWIVLGSCNSWWKYAYSRCQHLISTCGICVIENKLTKTVNWDTLVNYTSPDEVQCCFFSDAGVCTGNDHHFTINPTLTFIHCSVAVPSETQSTLSIKLYASHSTQYTASSAVWYCNSQYTASSAMWYCKSQYTVELHQLCDTATHSTQYTVHSFISCVILQLTVHSTQLHQLCDTVSHSTQLHQLCDTTSRSTQLHQLCDTVSHSTQFHQLCDTTSHSTQYTVHSFISCVILQR